MDSISLIAPAFRDGPRAQEFADFLADNVPGVLEAFDGATWYAWDTSVPPRDQWEREAEEFTAHLATL